jgi:hypothetical protein
VISSGSTLFQATTVVNIVMMMLTMNALPGYGWSVSAKDINQGPPGSKGQGGHFPCRS